MNVFLRQDVAENYDSYYKTDFGKKVDKLEKKIISELLNDIQKEKLLDIGCGTGHWTDFFVRHGFQVTGVDSSESMLNIAKRKNIKAQFILANSENLPFEDESYSIITSITMLEFVENQDKAIRELYRILKKGGWLIIGCLNADSTIGMNKKKDEVLKHANLFRISDLKSMFYQFKLLKINQGVYVKENYEIIEPLNNLSNIEPAFIGLLLQKL